MKAIDPDQAWLTDARARVAAGGTWERTPAELEQAVRVIRDHVRPALASQESKCPFCDTHPPLELFRRYELVTNTPLRFCPACYGFWAAGDSIGPGVADRYSEHPALLAAQAPRRCRHCNGHLKLNGDCAKCGRPLPSLTCPDCAVTMERVSRKSVAVDACPACHGIWFDMGEITAVFEIPPPQGLAASTVDEHATDGEPPAWAAALQILLGLFLRF